MYKKINDLPAEPTPSIHDDILMFSGETQQTKKITIGQLLGLQQQALNIPCEYCGSRGHYDIRGNCGACGAPVNMPIKEQAIDNIPTWGF